MIINLSDLENTLKVKFKKKSLLTNALTHKSSNQKNNNEKLEFLGDRVIGLILSQRIFELYPEETEGVLDKRFAALVNRNICFEVGWSMGLQDYILVGNKKKKITKDDKKIVSDCCEALIGAIFLDQGFIYSKNFILRVWKKYLDKSVITILDSKTKLQEYSLKHFKKLPIYKLVSSSGPKHNPIYKVSVSITGLKNFVGQGNSKQRAEQDCATKLLKFKKIN